MLVSTSSKGLLSADQVDEFFREGFLVIKTPQIVEPELSWCRDVLLGLIARRAGADDGRYFDLAAKDQGGDGYSPQISSPSFYAKELRKLSYRKTAMTVAKQLLGPGACFAGDFVIFKPEGVGGPTTWHQDEALRDPAFNYKELSFWIALTDCTLENGPMSYIPKSHLQEVLPHRLSGGSSGANMVECCDGFDPNDASTQPIPAGALIIHHVRTLHSASPNRSPAPRLAYILSYLVPPTPRKEPREFPWQSGLRRDVRATRNKSLRGMGMLREIMNIARSDRYADRHFVAGFIGRRLKQLRKIFHTQRK